MAAQQIGRAIHAVSGQREVGHADVKPVVGLEFQVAQVQLAHVVLVDDGDFDSVLARRQNLLRDETAVLVDRYGPPCNPDLVSGRNAVAADDDGAAAESDILTSQPTLAVSGKQSNVRRRCLLAGFCSAITAFLMHQPKRLRQRFIEIAILTVRTQHVLQFPHRRFELPRARLPCRQSFTVDLDNVDGI